MLKKLMEIKLEEISRDAKNDEYFEDILSEAMSTGCGALISCEGCATPT